MSEGLLKKRITEAYSKYYRGESAFGSKITDSIIDSAKKEFPVIVYENGEGTISSRIAIEWFKKWFGDSS